ncbi:hypothetical protein NNJEOMEG_00046 [Fundidesulfovibrio magnetotacticus]|uniref:Uncharacterized protein n=1 Tax=Fundidesulfovibrio magnetotacticus TaxID=2730080 RepID=A0A6V8LKL6_9BACT|nr:hypothetical protein [Fundidesulfovibrio magnetotacticus]GFK92224.1 hypothetical protein NNJEOMEG_00046 [Fundidesulfovibrio magnetotacticus]
MAGYIRLCDKNPDHHASRGKRSKIVRAKLEEMVGGKPDFHQQVLIRSVVPLWLQLEAWRLAFEAGEELSPDFMRVQGQVRATLAQLLATVPAAKTGTIKAAPKATDYLSQLMD